MPSVFCGGSCRRPCEVSAVYAFPLHGLPLEACGLSFRLLANRELRHRRRSSVPVPLCLEAIERLLHFPAPLRLSAYGKGRK